MYPILHTGEQSASPIFSGKLPSRCWTPQHQRLPTLAFYVCLHDGTIQQRGCDDRVTGKDPLFLLGRNRQPERCLQRAVTSETATTCSRVPSGNTPRAVQVGVPMPWSKSAVPCGQVTKPNDVTDSLNKLRAGDDPHLTLLMSDVLMWYVTNTGIQIKRLARPLCCCLTFYRKILTKFALFFAGVAKVIT
jgi:hypothetical protein